MVAGAGLFRRGRAEARLDPVRWRGPGRATLLRSATVALLVAVAGVLAWSGPAPCTAGPPTGAASGPEGSPPAGPAPPRYGPAGSTVVDSEPAGSAVARSGPAGAGSAGAGSAGAGSAGAGSADSAFADPDLPDPAVADAVGPTAAGQRPAVPPGTVGVPLRLTDPTALALVAPGDRVDVLRVEDSGRTAEVASAALVLGVTDAGDFVTAGLLVALTPAEAQRAVAHQGRGFAVLLRPG